MPASLGVGENLCSRTKAGLRELNVEVQGRVSNGTGSKHNEELQNFSGLSEQQIKLAEQLLDGSSHSYRTGELIIVEMLSLSRLESFLRDKLPLRNSHLTGRNC